MSIFEYVSVAYSMIAAITLSRLISGLAVIWEIKPKHLPIRIWPPILVFVCMSSFWSFWGYREVKYWSAGSFFLAILYPSLVLLAAMVLVPSEPEKFFTSNPTK